MNHSTFLDLATAAAKASRGLDDDSIASIRRFISKEQGTNGGFRGRDGAEDLYFSVFGSMTAVVIDARVDGFAFRSFLDRFGDGAELDFIHLVSLARCLAFADRLEPSKTPMAVPAADQLRRRIETHRSDDGGYRPVNDPATASTLYATFLAFLAYGDFHSPIPDPHALISFVKTRKAADGSYVNDAGTPSGSTTTTAAAVVLLAAFGEDVSPATLERLLERAAPSGGFFAVERSPVPDLLSTATALHALRTADVALDGLKEANYDFIESLWNEDGGFSGTILDSLSDCEFTYYALLALGSLES